MTRVLITRPEPGASRTLNALLAKAIDAEAIPLTEILPRAFEPPIGDFDALIVTSQNAVVYGATLLGQFKHCPVFVVGKHTAANFKGDTVWAETAEELLPKILNQAPKRLLYLCGKTRRPELEFGLKGAGLRVEAVEVYSASLSKNVVSKLKNFIETAKDAIILFYAPSAAAAFVSAMEKQKFPVDMRFLCLSAAIAAQLPGEWQKRVLIADHPDEASMLGKLDKLLA